MAKCEIISVMIDAKLLGKRLQKLRKNRKMPQIEVATAIGISRSRLAEIEGGEDPGFRTFCDLADFYETSLDYLYRGTPQASIDISLKQVNDPEELTLLEFWRSLSDDEKNLLRGLFRRGAQGKVA